MLSDPALLMTLFSGRDGLAFGFLILAWIGSGVVIERAGRFWPSTNGLMSRYRELWMQEMVRREVRIYDSAILAMLREGTSFFASACMIAIGGGMALLGQAERLAMLASDLSLEAATPRVVWETKILVVILILASAFLNFVWAHRLFGYCAVIMGAVPQNDGEEARRMAARAARINISAARTFNRGLRGVYFALASLAWLLGPAPLALAVAVTLVTNLMREFRSESRQALRED